MEHFFDGYGAEPIAFLAFSIFCDTSGVTNRINRRLITLKGNSSGFNRILITAYRCLLVTLNYHAFPLFTSFFLLKLIKRLVFCTAESLPLFLIHSIIFRIHQFFVRHHTFKRLKNVGELTVTEHTVGAENGNLK